MCDNNKNQRLTRQSQVTNDKAVVREVADRACVQRSNPSSWSKNLSAERYLVAMRVIIGMVLASLLYSWPVGSQEPVFVTYDWRETLDLEHQDRIDRLTRLASEFSEAEAPLFFEYVVSKKDLPAHYATDIPVLRVVFSEKSFFDTAKSDLRPEAVALIDIIADNLKREPPDVTVFVAGHTDSRGSDEYNHNLSIDRANTVAKEIANRGVGGSSIWRIGFGESLPIATNRSKEGMALNRRVEFLFAGKSEAAVYWLSTQADIICPASDAKEAKKCRKQIKIDRTFEAVEVLAQDASSLELAAEEAGEAYVETDRTAIGAAAPRTMVIEVRSPKQISIQVRSPRKTNID